MAIIRYQPWSVLNSIQDEINKAFGNLPEDSSNSATSSWSPNIDIKEKKDGFEVLADIPGVDPKDIKVNMENNTLTIQGERKSEKKEENEKFSRIERFAGSFFRTFTLPDSIDKNNIKALSKHGVLKLIIPKKEPEQSQLIKIDTEEG